MNIVIVGIGKFGKEITKQLSKENHNIIVIDEREDKIEDVVNEYDVNGYCGNGCSYDSLKEANVSSFDLLIAVTGSDEVNMLACLIAKNIGIKYTLARIRNKDYSTQIKLMSDKIGVDYAINPDLATALEIYRIIKFPLAAQVETFAHGKVELVDVKIEKDSPLTSCSLWQLREKYKVSFLVCAVKRGNDIFIPKGDFTLQEGDFAYITADTNEIRAAFRKMGISKIHIDNVFIIGGSKISLNLAEILLRNKYEVKIFDKDKNTCLELSEDLPNATIINSDATNQKNLNEEGFNKADSIVTLTNYDETNIVISAYAKKLNTKKIITKISNIDYDLVTENIGLDSVISPKEIFASFVIRYVREIENKNKNENEFKNLHRLLNNRVEAIEFIISKESDYTSKPIKDLHIKKNCLLASIIRGDKVITPTGNDTIEVNDHLILIAYDQPILSMKDIF